MYCAQKVRLQNVAYMDDLALPVVEDAPKLVEKCVCVARVANKVFVRFGFEVNFSPGKSEALPLFFGTGSKVARIALETGGSKSWLFDQVYLRFVGSYKHVGTNLDRTVDSNYEAATRAASIASGIYSYKKVPS